MFNQFIAEYANKPLNWVDKEVVKQTIVYYGRSNLEQMSRHLPFKNKKIIASYRDKLENLDFKKQSVILNLPKIDCRHVSGLVLLVMKNKFYLFVCDRCFFSLRIYFYVYKFVNNIIHRLNFTFDWR